MKWSNLTEADISAVKTLRTKDNVHLPSDKDTEFCVIDETRYNIAAENHLQDPNTYKNIPRMTATTVEKKINKTWKNILCKKRNIPKRMKNSFVSSNTDLPRYYQLIKTHKINQGIKIRPIVSNNNGATKRISWLLFYILTPKLTEVPAHLENSMSLINKIQSLDVATNNEFPYPFSLDVVSLYTSIPIQEAIENIVERLETNTTYCSLTTDVIKNLLTVVLQNTYFTFQSNIYLQHEGLPMGSSLSGLLAIVFMDTIERKTLTGCQPIGL